MVIGSCFLVIVGGWSKVVGHLSMALCGWLLVDVAWSLGVLVGRWLLIVGRLALVVGCWFLIAVGWWFLVVGRCG